MATTSLTLTQFETIDELFRACLNRPSLEQCMKHGRKAANAVYFLPEWKLDDACVEAIGLEAARAFPCAVDCAASLLTDCMLGKVEVLDMEAV